MLDRYSSMILATTVLWGTFWIPLRKLDDYGDGSVVLIAASIALPLILLLPWLIKRRHHWGRGGMTLMALGFFFGAAAALYGEGTLRGSVARVILLFYLTPVWSTLLARIFLNEPITPRRVVTLILGITGLYVILGVDTLLPLPSNSSEWMGLTAGFCWGVAMVLVQKNQHSSVIDQTGAALLGFLVVLVLLTLIPGGRSWEWPAFISTTTLDNADWVAIIGWPLLWVILFGLLWNLPTTLLTLIGAAKVEPGKVAILLMMEVLIGIGTAAVLTDEPFGYREVAGAVLVLSASIVEFLPRKKTR